MTKRKEIQPHTGGKKISSQTAEFVSKKQATDQKSKQQHFPVVDIRKIDRQEHTNGSTPRKDI